MKADETIIYRLMQFNTALLLFLCCLHSNKYTFLYLLICLKSEPKYFYLTDRINVYNANTFERSQIIKL